ncbi:hypothetical protein CAPTEDRAFT_205791 [Capitella teleta]|uniref:MalT-like TPR region domain-containing protein n=1 Tax=Capitella teleta TaxID=283909 RepID=R7UBN3_CAPTE|nr:hypothetical protein CAPTEDRAFT_205791 [Capitella teleta]|eukprot:ELU01213.1 hypothetical protein CAPTEDRAFT_205791 [Capitella teleta]
MSNRCHQTNEFWILVTTLWQEAQEAITRKDFHLMRSLAERILTRCKMLKWMRIENDVRLDVCEIFMLAGNECNACKEASHLAKDFFSNAVLILAGVGRSERSCKNFSAAFVGLIRTHLHNDDMESAKVLLDDMDRSVFIDDHPDMDLAVARGSMEFGLALVKKHHYGVGTEYLTRAVQVLEESDPEFHDSESEGIFASALGLCLYMETGAVGAIDIVRRARLIWKSLNWPSGQIDSMVDCLKILLACLLWVDDPYEEAEVYSELLMLNCAVVSLHNDMLVPRAFTFLGMVASDNKQHEKAAAFLEQACTLHKQNKNWQRSEQSCTEIRKLLKLIGDANYNSCNYANAAFAYLECLHLLETQQPVQRARVADLCASLGRTLEALEDDKCSFYYKRAKDLKAN